jgi:hypothetical protein
MAAPDSTETPDTTDTPDFVPPKRRLWPFAAVLAAAAGVAGFFGYRAMQEPAPLRVVVAVDLDGHFWEGSRPSAALVDELCQRLDAIGFEPVRAGDPAILKVLQDAESPEAAARKLRASFVVTAKLGPQIIEHPTPGGYYESRVDAAIEVHHVADDVVDKGRLVGWAGAKEKTESLRLLGESLAVRAFDQVMPLLVKHPSIQAIFKGNDIKLADRVAKAKKYVEAKTARLEEAQKTYDDLAKRRREHDKGPAKVTYHAAMGAQDGLGGVGPSGFLVKTADVTPFVVPRTGNLSYFNDLETLEWRTLDGKRTLLWSGYHLFSYPSVAPSGGPAVFVEDLFGWAKTITVVESDGKSRRVRIDPEHRFLDPEIAPGGKACALYDRSCQTCRGNLLVLSLDDGRPLFERPHENGTFSGFAWLGPQRIAFVQTPAPWHAEPPKNEVSDSDLKEPEPPRDSLYIVDLAASPPSVEKVYTAAPDKSLGALKASRDGKLLAMEHYEEWVHIGVYDVESKAFHSYDGGFEARTPSFSPDGKTLAFIRGGDIALFNLETKKHSRLTDNPWRERYPIFSDDGARVFFESRSDDPLFERRELSLVGSVAVRDAGPPDGAEPSR